MSNHRKNLRERGLCVRCEVPSDKRFCLNCRDYVNAKNRARWKKYKSLGLCIICARPTVDGLSRCIFHTKKANASAKLNTELFCKKCHDYRIAHSLFCQKHDDENANFISSLAANGQICTQCKKRNSLLGKRLCDNCEKPRRVYKHKLKLTAFDKYGGRFCKCCKIDNVEFLSIDHINSDGSKHRKEMKKEQYHSIYRWLNKHNYPIGFQVLCFNCNMSKGIFGYCPHQTLKGE